MSRFLTLKHWQLFGLLLILPMIFQFVMAGAVVSTNDPAIMFKAFPIVMILYSAIFFGWFYSLGTNLHQKLPTTVNMNLNIFKIFILFPVVYLLIISLGIAYLFSNTSFLQNLNPVIFILIIPFHLFSMFCIFYCLYFISKALKAVEWQKQVTFSDYAGEFFLLWFFPIGIWIIQPRINQLFDNNIDNTPESPKSPQAKVYDPTNNVRVVGKRRR
jgi:hypothetical protein